MAISIHVPSWGTTAPSSAVPEVPSFQSTFPRGERHRPGSVLSFTDTDFNPRSLVGNDEALISFYDFDFISIHVPSWGTTG